jgi:hypothetical protein
MDEKRSTVGVEVVAAKLQNYKTIKPDAIPLN